MTQQIITNLSGIIRPSWESFLRGHLFSKHTLLWSF